MRLRRHPRSARLTTLVAVASISAVVAVAGCTSGTVGGPSGSGDTKELKVATDAEPATFDWAQSTAGATQVAGIQVFETLYAVDAEYGPVPMLASDVPEVSSDGLTYTIPLRDGVKFHNGDTMTADDVVASLERWGQVSSIGQAMFAHVADISSTTPQSVTIKLKEPYDVVRTLAVPVAAAVIMPAKIVEQYGKDTIEDVKDLVGTGPYKLTSWQKGQEYVLERFEDYTGVTGDPGGLAGAKEATFDKVEVSFVPDANTRFESTSTGQYDMALNVPGDLYGQIKSSDSLEAQIIQPYYSQFLLLNTAEPPFDDVRVRHAVALAIDEKAMGENTYGEADLYELSPGIYPQGVGVLSSDVGADTYDQPDVQQAKSLLKAAGYDGEKITFMTSKDIAQVYNASVAVQSQLKDAGFNVELDVVDWATMNGRYTEPKTWGMFSTAFGIGYILPSAHLLLSGHFPFDGWYAASGKMPSLLQDWQSTKTDEEKATVMAEIQEQFYRDQPAVKLGDYAALNAVANNLDVSGMTFYWPTWWNASRK